MVSLYTNQPAFFADIADELRLFLAMEEIVPAEACGASCTDAVSVVLEEDGGLWRARAAPGDRLFFDKIFNEENTP